jgi:hypothetical protein
MTDDQAKHFRENLLPIIRGTAEAGREPGLESNPLRPLLPQLIRYIDYLHAKQQTLTTIDAIRAAHETIPPVGEPILASSETNPLQPGSLESKTLPTGHSAGPCQACGTVLCRLIDHEHGGMRP